VARGHVVPVTGAGAGPVLNDGRVQMPTPVGVVHVIGTGWVLVEADPEIIAGMAVVFAVHVAGVHLVVARRAACDTSLHEA
jgi:hypothetical protein